jgi:hypothetical protein
VVGAQGPSGLDPVIHRTSAWEPVE